MKYTNYITERVKEFGAVNAPKDRIYKLSKIIACEAKIQFYLDLEIDGEPKKFELERFELGRILSQLTGNLDPETCIPKIIQGVHF